VGSLRRSRWRRSFSAPLGDRAVGRRELRGAFGGRSARYRRAEAV
jgi:hypothetical protein